MQNFFCSEAIKRELKITLLLLRQRYQLGNVTGIQNYHGIATSFAFIWRFFIFEMHQMLQKMWKNGQSSPKLIRLKRAKLSFLLWKVVNYATVPNRHWYMHKYLWPQEIHVNNMPLLPRAWYLNFIIVPQCQIHACSNCKTHKWVGILYKSKVLGLRFQKVCP